MRGGTLFQGRHLEQNHLIFQPDILVMAGYRSVGCNWLIRGVIAHSNSSDSSAGKKK
jgi:hypothetical protein